MFTTLTDLDHSVFYWFYNLSGRSMLGDAFIVACAQYLIYVVILFVFWHAYRMWVRQGRKAFVPYIEAFVSIAIGNGILIPLIRHVYPRIRPFVALSLNHNLLIDSAYSFPSGHTIFMFALATSIYFYDRRFGIFLYILGIIIGLSRVAAGVHYPSDILGGAVLGIIVGLIVYAFSRKILPAGRQV